MSHDKLSRAPRPIRFLFENSMFLVGGAVLALMWANLGPQTGPRSYSHFVEIDLGQIFFGFEPLHPHDPAADGHADGQGADANEKGADGTAPAADGHVARGHAPDEHGSDGSGSAAPGSDGHDTAAHGSGNAVAADSAAEAADAHAAEPPTGIFATIYYAFAGRHGLTVHFLINDILMALFFAIAGKEVWESMLPGGALSNPRKAATPLLATLGGILGPAGVYVGGALMLGQADELGRGWAIPCATDIAFSYLVARLIFGAGHPAIAFLLLLAIADDAAGLVILAVFYPQQDLVLPWLLLTLAAIGLGFSFRRLGLQSFWWYLLIPGVMAWLSFKLAGIHAALGLVPIIPCMPHAHTDLGLFAREELKRHDTLNEFEHWWKNPVELILGLFGLANAGVGFSAVGAGTFLVLAGLIIGKPLGITAMSWFAKKVMGLDLPAGMDFRHVLTLGTIAGIGFTVALFVSTAAFPTPGPIQDSVKMGALGSFLAAVLSFAVAKVVGIGSRSEVETEPKPKVDEPEDELGADPSASVDESTIEGAVS